MASRHCEADTAQVFDGRRAATLSSAKIRERLPQIRSAEDTCVCLCDAGTYV